MDARRRLSSISMTGRKSARAQESPFLYWCSVIAHHPATEVVTTIATIFALFGNDIKIWGTPKAADLAFDILTLVSLVIFTAEIIICSIGKEGYFMQTFFWFDVVSTVTLILDLSWVYYQMFLITEESANANSTDVLRASRAGKAGSQVARMLRVIRLVRLIRVAKLYKTIAVRLQAQEEENEQADIFIEPGDRGADDIGIEDEVDTNEEGEEYESKIGKELTDLTTRKVIYIILAMTFILPFLSEEQYITKFTSEQIGLDKVAEAATGVVPELPVTLL